MLKPVEYPSTYVDQAFFIWYNNDKISAAKLHGMLPDYTTLEGEVCRPGISTLKKWVVDDFAVRAETLDTEITDRMNSLVISEKVEMLRRHVHTAQKMQTVAMEYLDKHKEDLTSPAAIRLLIEGIRIEKESVGLPEALEKMTKLTDDELLDEVQKLITDKSQIYPLE